MARTSDLPEPNKAISILVNHQLRTENRALHDKQVGLEAAYKKLAEGMQVLREGVEETLPARLQLLESGVKAVDEKCEAGIQTLGGEVKMAQHSHAQDVAHSLTKADEKRGVELQALGDEVKTSLETHAQELIRILKEDDTKRGDENQRLRDEMAAIKTQYHDILERFKALEDTKRDTHPVGATNRPHKKPRTVQPTSQKPTHSTANEAGPATKRPLPITQTDQETYKSNRLPQTAASASSGPQMDSSATIIATTSTVPRFHDRRVRQGNFSLRDYAAAFAHHVTSICDTDVNQNVGGPGPAEREALRQFMVGMKNPTERIQLVGDMEKAGWAVFNREAKGVKFIRGWAAMEEVLEGWEKVGVRDGGKESK